MKRRIMACVMAILLLGTILLSPAQAERSLAGMEKPDYLGEYEGQELIRGSGIVLFGASGIPKSVHYFYSDAYFAGSSKTYDNHLSSFAMNLSGASGVDANVAKILGECGFADVEANDAYQKDTMDGAGTIFGHKTIKIDGQEQTVVVAVIRSRNYGAEWGNNFLVGTEGDAKGFSTAADYVEKDLDAYITNKKLDATKTKYLITGHSRGAAVTDILARNLTDKYSADQVYGYCFAGPRAVLESNRKSVYENIHNVSNKKDLFLYFPMEDLGFGFNGKVEDMTGFASLDKVNEQLAKMGSEVKLDNEFDMYALDIFTLFTAMQSKGDLAKKDVKSVENKDLEKGDVVENGKVVSGLYDKIMESNAIKKKSKLKMTQEEFIQNTVDAIERSVFKSRKHYSGEVIEGAVTIEEAIRTLVDVYCVESSQEGFFKLMLDSFKGVSLSSGEMMLLFLPMLGGLDQSQYSDDHQAYYDKLWSIVDPALKTNMSKDGYAKIKKIWPTMVNFVCELVPGVMNDKKLADKKLTFDVLLGTWFKNAEKIVEYHYGETSLAYVRAADDFYEREDEKPQERPEVETEKAGDASAPVVGSVSVENGDGGVIAIAAMAGVVGGFIAGLLCMYALNQRRKEALEAREKEENKEE